jgi:hypothetical protein
LDINRTLPDALYLAVQFGLPVQARVNAGTDLEHLIEDNGHSTGTN